MYFTIEEIEVPKSHESPKDEPEEEREEKEKRSPRKRNVIVNSIQFMTLKLKGSFHFFITQGKNSRQRKHKSKDKGIRARLSRITSRLTVRSEIMVMVLGVLLLVSIDIFVNIYRQYSHEERSAKAAKVLQNQIAQHKILQQDMQPIVSFLAQEKLYDWGSNILALEDVLTAIEAQFHNKLYFTQISLGKDTALFYMEGVAVSLEVLLQLEHFLFEQCLHMSYSVNIKEDQHNYFDIALNPIKACTI